MALERRAYSTAPGKGKIPVAGGGGNAVSWAASDGLRREWLNEEVATAYLKRAGFELRRDQSWRPPTGRKHLTEKERRAMLYLVREYEFDGLLTDAQHAERRRQLKL